MRIYRCVCVKMQEYKKKSLSLCVGTAFVRRPPDRAPPQHVQTDASLCAMLVCVHLCMRVCVYV